MWRVSTAIVTSTGNTYKLKRSNGYEQWAVITHKLGEPVLGVGDVLDEEFKPIPQEYDLALDITGYGLRNTKKESIWKRLRD